MLPQLLRFHKTDEVDFYVELETRLGPAAAAADAAAAAAAAPTRAQSKISLSMRNFG
jgi:hypothetical protein